MDHSAHNQRGVDSSGKARHSERRIYSNDKFTASKPDEAVKELENRLISSKGHGLDLSALQLNCPTPIRPGFGTKGSPVMLMTNSFEVGSTSAKILHRYSIQTIPEIANGRMKRQLIKLLLKESPVSSLGPALASDFATILVTSQPLNPNQLQFSIVFRDEDEVKPDPAAPTYHMTISADGTFSVAGFISLLKSANLNADFSEKADLVQLLNIIANTAPKLQNSRRVLSTRTNKHFRVTDAKNPGNCHDLGGGLQAWRGFFSSLRAATSRFIVNVQVKRIAMFKPQQLDLYMGEFVKAEGFNAAKLHRLLRRVRVDFPHPKDEHRQGKSRPMTISGLSSSKDGNGLQNPPIFYFPKSKRPAFAREIEVFTSRNAPRGVPPDSYTVVADLFKRADGVKLEDQTPVVNVGTKANPSYAPPELCRIVPAQAAMTELAPEQTARMIKFAVQPPHENARSIAEIGLGEIGLIQENLILVRYLPVASEFLLITLQKSFGLEVDPHMIAVNARILTPPYVKYGGSRKIQPDRGGWNLAMSKFYKGGKLSHWSILWIQTTSKDVTSEQIHSDGVNPKDAWSNNPTALEKTLEQFCNALSQCGINASKASLPGVRVAVKETSSFKDYTMDENEIEKGFRKLLKTYRSLQFVLVILPSASKTTYNAVKRCSDKQFGISCSCVNGNKFAKPNNIQYFANVALKVNLKLGGVNHLLGSGLPEFITKGETMVVGIDVTHPSPMSAKEAPSVAAMVASTDGNLSQFLADIKLQEGRVEMVAQLSGMLQSRLKIWRRHNGDQLPKKILVYRDGVSAGQHDLVLKKEWPLLKKACEEEYPARNRPAFTILIGAKRINQRFYPTSTDAKVTDMKSANVISGTVIDRSITEARNWDFYMVAHRALQGTAVPCHYFVVLDEIFRKAPLPPGMSNPADMIQEVTHSMCYVFGRATRAISYAAPAYYADMVCERARRYLSEQFSPSGSQVDGSATETDTSLKTFGVHANIKDTMFFL